MTSMSYALLATTYNEMKRGMTQEIFPHFSESGWIIFLPVCYWHFHSMMAI